MVYRIYVEKKPELAHEAQKLFSDAVNLLGIKGLERVRVLNRYDAEGLSEELFDYAVGTVFSEPQLDLTFTELEAEGGMVFAVEYLPGQFDQRADSAAQCIQIISHGEKPTVQTARVYVLYGDLSEADVSAIKKYVINPVESREAALDVKTSLKMEYEVPGKVAVVEGLREMDDAALAALLKELGLAMDLDDLRFCRDYFVTEQRDPTITEIRMIDTYWSDHCRHTTFNTTIDSIKFHDPEIEAAYQSYVDTRKALGRTKPVNLMDMATMAVRALRANGQLDRLDQSEEVNACTVTMDIEVDGVTEPWLLLFKNETHNHPTEIEPFGGAATCIGGAIRDPLSGRSYVYGAMRLTGAANPLTPVSETMAGKLPQRTIVTTAAAGYSSYGNQIGLATGIVDELYHPGYAAKRMEIGAVVAAAPAKNVRREVPAAGDLVILLGGRTGRDGCGGATGSSKSHTMESLESCGAEVQKGNAPEERKLQRLFRNYEACRMIKRCNDFGAGGVSVAIGELADGLDIDLNAVPKKYEGLDGTELAISESQERMAVVIEAKDRDGFLALAAAENLEATVVATVTDLNRLVMHWNGDTIVDISRDFLNSNGAEKHIDVEVAAPAKLEKAEVTNFKEGILALAADLNVCSKRGLSERFDSTIGAGTVLMPFGGKYQRTPAQAMAQKVSVEKGHTDDCSVMAWGFNPYLSSQSPYHGAYLAVVESVSKLIASGASFDETYLTFQEYFEKLGRDPKRWGKPAAALLGAFRAQMDLGLGAIGGKDSMSGTFEKLDVPPTLVSFAVTHDKANYINSGEFKQAGTSAVLLKPEYDENGLPSPDSLKQVFATVTKLLRDGTALSAYTVTFGGVAEAILKMCMGNGYGFDFAENLAVTDLFKYSYGAFILEVVKPVEGILLGTVTEKQAVTFGGEEIPMAELTAAYEGKLESVFSCNIAGEGKVEKLSHEAKSWPAPAVKHAKPRILIPVFPGTNCEFDSAKVMRDAGAEADIVVLCNRTGEETARSAENFAKAVKESQMIFIPGGFSGGDEPDGSGKFITAFFRSAAVKEQVTALLEQRDGLICGICNGFQALIKLGLVPYGKIIDTDETCPTLTFNTIGRHQSKIVRTRVASNKSPWLKNTNVGDVYNVPISHGEGRFLASEEVLKQLIANGQVATQYVDMNGEPTMDIQYNPNGSLYAIEGITSPDGRVFGKMGHAERIGSNLYRNVPGNYEIGMFKAAVEYFK